VSLFLKTVLSIPRPGGKKGGAQPGGGLKTGDRKRTEIRIPWTVETVSIEGKNDGGVLEENRRKIEINNPIRRINSLCIKVRGMSLLGDVQTFLNETTRRDHLALRSSQDPELNQALRNQPRYHDCANQGKGRLATVLLGEAEGGRAFEPHGRV